MTVGTLYDTQRHTNANQNHVASGFVFCAVSSPLFPYMNSPVPESVNGGIDASGYAYVAALVVSAALVLWLFPFSFLAGRGLFFFDGEIVSEISSWLYFARDAWQMPLLFTPWLNYPEGLSIAFTNSIPLLAVLFKPFAGLLPTHFQYFGLWHALALVLQALGAVFLLRSLGVRSIVAGTLAAGFSLLWPMLLMQFGRSALLAQGVILFALGCYFRGYYHRWTATRTVWTLVILCQVALLLQTYLLVMCYAVFLAFLLHEGMHYRQWGRQGAILGISLVTTGILAALFGYWGGPGAVAAYGDHALSLNAPWCGGNAVRWLGCSPPNYPHDAYFGLGGLLVVIAGAVVAWRQAFGFKAFRAHAALTAVCLALLLFAITHRIHVGVENIYTLPLSESVQAAFSTFAFSERFFWLVAYVLLFGSMAALFRRGWAGLAVVAVALGLQWYDTQPARDEIRVAAHAPERGFDPAWQAALRDIAHINMFPAFGCGDIDPITYLPVQYLAARAGATFNTAYAPGLRTPCDVKHARFNDDIPSGVLHLAPATLPGQALPPSIRMAAQHGQCTTLTVAPVLDGVSRPQAMLVCRNQPASDWSPDTKMPASPQG